MNQLIRIFQEILYLGAIASIPVVLILTMKKLFHKVVSPKWHYYIWALLIIRLLVPYIPESSFSIFNLVYAVTEQSNLLENQMEATILYGPNSSISDNAENLQAVTDNTIADEKEELQQNESPSSQSQPAKKKLTYQAILALLWLAGVIVLSGYTLYVNIAFAIKLRKYYRRVIDPRIEAIFLECKKLLKVKGRISLFTSRVARTPSLYTSFGTRILLSEEHMTNLSDQEIRYIFFHELTHYKRKDIVVNWLLMFLQIIYFFQPLLWYAFFKIHEDCEISCDAEVLKYFGEDRHQEYGSTILKLLRLHADSRFIPVTAGIGKHKSSYRRRIIMIKQFKKYRWTNTLVTLILILAVGLVGMTGCSIKETEKESPNTDIITVTPTPIITETPDDQDAQPNDEVSDGTETVEDEDNIEPSPAQDDANPTADPSLATDEEPVTAPEPAEDDQAAYYGDWTINQLVAFGQSGTYSREDVAGLIGRDMSFTADSATSFGDQASYIDIIANNPTYTATEYTSEDFIAYYRMSFDLLGLTGDTVTEIVAVDAEGNGCTFLIKDENTLILVGGGTYF
ncbi:MAG: peptidase BlaR1, partial [Herbinix sp.]|nr:peptidase BlaR1 [Herbinix sp.]